MRILAFAYACEPGHGSEPGAGWGWARLLARLGETWVITRANNREAIEAEVGRITERDRLHFVYMDLPPWARSWKRGQRGVRLYYLLWQIAAVRRGRRMDRSIHFELVWHLTLANAWLGSLAPLVGHRFIYGPVGGGVKSPWRLLPVLGARGIAYEAFRGVARFVGRYVNPLSRLSWRRAALILAQNGETRYWLPERYRSKAVIFPNVVLEEVPSVADHSPASSTPTALFAGRLLAWKGASLAVRALSYLPGWRLIIFGSGPDEGRLRRLVRRAHLQSRVVITKPVPRHELLRWMGEADVFLFPSLHDEAGWVVAEAAVSGLPVVCLDVGGPPLLGGRAVRPSTPSRTAAALAEAVRDASRLASRKRLRFDLPSRAAVLADLLISRGLLPPDGQPPGGLLVSEAHHSTATDSPGRG